MKKNFLIVSLLLFGFILMLACSSSNALREGQEKKISKNDQPDWIIKYKDKSTKTQRAIVGVSKNYAMESSARSDAILQAQKEAITLISSSVARHLKEALASQAADADIVEEATVKQDISEVMAKSEFEGEVEEYFIEKYEKMSGGAVKQYYKAYALVLFPRNLAEISAKKAMEKARIAADTDAKKRQIEKAEELINKQVFDW